MARSKKPKKPDELTTEEAIDQLFHPDMADALRQELAEKNEDSIEDEDA
ncbi:MAG TPA: hypothetical protein VGA38_11700 [Candidatus Limnocylindria bacterium]